MNKKTLLSNQSQRFVCQLTWNKIHSYDSYSLKLDVSTTCRTGFLLNCYYVKHWPSVSWLTMERLNDWEYSDDIKPVGLVHVQYVWGCFQARLCASLTAPGDTYWPCPPVIVGNLLLGKKWLKCQRMGMAQHQIKTKLHIESLSTWDLRSKQKCQAENRLCGQYCVAVTFVPFENDQVGASTTQATFLYRVLHNATYF